MGSWGLLEIWMVPTPMVCTTSTSTNSDQGAHPFCPSIGTARANCDNEAVVTVNNSGYSREPFISHLLRCIFFFSGRNNASYFLSSIPMANKQTKKYSQTSSTTFCWRSQTGHLDTLVSFYFHSALAPSTQQSYELAKRRYCQFCINTSKFLLPLTEVCLFVTTKIARSGDLGIIARYKYHCSVGKVGKYTIFRLLDPWKRSQVLQITCFYRPRLLTTPGYATRCFNCACSN